MKKSKDEIRYFTFPIELLMSQDIEKLCKKALYYSVYAKARSIATYLEQDQVTTENIEQAMKYFNLNHNSLEKRLDEGQDIYNRFYSDKAVLTSVNVKIVLQFINEAKSDLDIKVFRAFCGIRSIIGVKNLAKTNWGHLTARMYGCNNVHELTENFEHSLNMSRYQHDKVILELRLSWYLQYYSNRNRGFYVSFDLPLKQIITVAEQSRKSRKVKELKITQNEVYAEVMKNLKKVG
jgi:hypothetical protein